MPIRAVPFRPTLIALVVVVVAVGTGGISISSYVSGKQRARLLWRELSGHLAREAMHQSLRFLEPAVPYVEQNRLEVSSGRLDLSDEKALLRHLKAALESHPSFTWSSFGRADGTYFTVWHDDTGTLRTEIRRSHPSGPTEVESYVWRSEGDPEIDKRTQSDYQPLKRPWYLAAASDDHDLGHWGQPYLFASNHHPGVIYSRREVVDGVVRGVWTAEWELSHLDDFLARLRVIERGLVYIVTPEGDVVGHPLGHQIVSDATTGAERLRHVDEYADPVLKNAFEGWKKRGGGTSHLETHNLLVAAEPFPAEMGIPWVVLVVVPADTVFGPLWLSLTRDGLIAAFTALLALGLGVWFSTRVSQALIELAGEMGRVGQFDLTERPLLGTRSSVREVNVMTTAFESMKASLRSFAKYVPAQVVGELLRSGQEARLGGQKQQLSVLFCDVAGFTSISERMTPDALVDALGEFLHSASGAVMSQAGTVDKFIGDAVMAFWGAPQPQEDHALRACRAALDLQHRSRELAKRFVAAGRPAFNCRIGINTGDALVGNIGAPDRLNYTAMGDAVNVASRLEGLNKAYGTTLIVGETTANRVKEQLELRLLDYVAVKGRGQAMAVYELIGEKNQAPVEVVARARRYEAALNDYRSRRFADAANAFEVLSKEGDATAELMAERCREFVTQPPPENWDGAHVMETK
jgi:adenylate cyclase